MSSQVRKDGTCKHTKRKRVSEKDFRELKRMVKGTNAVLEGLVFSKDKEFHGTRVSPEEMEYSNVEDQASKTIGL